TAATPDSASGGAAFLSRAGGGFACTSSSPCSDMATALNVAGANGEVICLDKGFYAGPDVAVGIIQSVTISCGDGLWEDYCGLFSINTPAGSDVVIEGLVLDRTGCTGTPLTVLGQGTIHLRRVRIGNSPGPSNGLQFLTNGPAKLHITDSVFYNNGNSGVLIKPQAGGSANVHIRNTRFEHNMHGISVDGTSSTTGINVSMAESAAVDNQGNGIGAYTGSAPVTVSAMNSQVTGNFTHGIGV